MAVRFIFFNFVFYISKIYMWDLQMEYEDTPGWLFLSYDNLQVIFVRNNH
jgi:hypothetical protein